MRTISRLIATGLAAGLLCSAITVLGSTNSINDEPVITSPDPAGVEDHDLLRSAPIGTEYGLKLCGFVDGKFRAFTGTNPNAGIIWAFTAGGEILSSAAVDNDGVFYFGCSDGKIYAVNTNGKKKWSYETGDAVVSSPALGDDGTVYVGSKDGYVYALTAGGELKWRYQTQAAVYASPSLALNGTVYVGSLDGNMYALSPDGSLAWSYETGGAIYSSAAIDMDGSVSFGSTDFNVYSLNPDGTLKWSVTTGDVVVSSPALNAEGVVFIGSGDGTLNKISADGELVWSYQINAPVWGSVIIDLFGMIHASTCSAFRVYYEGYESLADVPFEDFIASNFGANDEGDTFSPGSYSSGASSSEGKLWSDGFTGAVTALVTGETVMFMGTGGSSSQFGVMRGYEGNTTWPRFRHDMRNTGNLATSLAIPEIDIEIAVPEYICDVDGSGEVDLGDFRYMLKMTITSPDDPAIAGYDFNDDGRISISDAIKLLLKIFSHQCSDGGTMLASTEFQEGALDGLNAGYVKAFEIAMDGMDLSAEERELIEAALNGVGASATLPRAFSLAQNSPNPFNPSTTIAYEVPQSSSGAVNLSVFDVRGRLVKTLVNGRVEPGKHFVFWDGTDENGRHLSSGVYFYRMRADSFQTTRKMVLVK